MGRNNVFQKDHYIEEWRGSKLIGVVKQLARDLQFCHQRITRGFSDADTWSIDSWFLHTMEEMLTFYKENRYGSPGELGENFVDERGILVNETCHEEWDKILDQMIRLLKEADEETTSAVNACEEEYYRATEEFTRKYGSFGERLDHEDPGTDKTARTAPPTRPTKRFHSIAEIPEYEDVWKRYSAEEDRIFQYRDHCKDEFMDLFKKWFWALWD